MYLLGIRLRIKHVGNIIVEYFLLFFIYSDLAIVKVEHVLLLGGWHTVFHRGFVPHFRILLRLWRRLLENILAGRFLLDVGLGR